LVSDLVYNGDGCDPQRLHLYPICQRVRFLDRGRSLPLTREFMRVVVSSCLAAPRKASTGSGARVPAGFGRRLISKNAAAIMPPALQDFSMSARSYLA
jgi:hypothetical protein